MPNVLMVEFVKSMQLVDRHTSTAIAKRNFLVAVAKNSVHWNVPMVVYVDTLETPQQTRRNLPFGLIYLLSKFVMTSILDRIWRVTTVCHRISASA
jgi:hypothetical protein